MTAFIGHEMEIMFGAVFFPAKHYIPHESASDFVVAEEEVDPVGYSDEAATPAALTFPTEPVPQYPFEERALFKTTVSPMENGSEKRIRRWSDNRRVIVLRWKVLEQDDVDTLWDFYLSAQGRFRAFVLYDPQDGVTSLGNFRFVDDGMTRENFEAALWSTGLEVIEVI